MRLLMSDSSALVFVPSLARGLLASAPGVRCLVEHLATDSLTKIDHGVADFCITVEQRELLESSPVSDSLVVEPLFEDEFVVITDGSGPFANEPLTLERFLELPYVEVRFTYTVFGVVETAFRQQKLPVRVGTVMPSFIEAAGLIRGTPMTTVIPRQLARRIAPVFDLDVHPAPMTLPPLRETLIWHKRNDADPAHVWFRSYLQNIAAGLDFGPAPAATEAIALSAAG
jgi:DNA-binding transcriptional LysR family regulator